MTSEHRTASIRAAMALALLALPGCGAKHPAPPPAPLRHDFSISMTSSPLHPRQLDPAAFTVILSDARGKPMAGGIVTIALSMPGMDMPANQFTALPKSPGEYVGTGRFTMAGDWVAIATAIVHRPQKPDLEAQGEFPITVVP